jgi:L-lysine 2,3-aminomutase
MILSALGYDSSLTNNISTWKTRIKDKLKELKELKDWDNLEKIKDKEELKRIKEELEKAPVSKDSYIKIIYCNIMEDKH